ncbi:cobalamin-5'-phosphate synthase [Kribbella sp. VKM Ac-2527]|uniref:Adenosylcobinamide-GDP ribazoletransferase n=1 Tax=Kribbella caucasensis TaxID=2512215 RepID=A0A4R6K2J7_9ACTN|nr:adenosylcobinamide-GDP ribazoletransferase [Kribbella sp. VKM Ac-2527]TDO43379.1 cobalamin-5'-phosphate synthase [Kribbella sp. VKM Ac-2527]
MLDGLKLALGTLTVLPAPMPSKVDRRIAGRAMVFAPGIGLLLGGFAALVVAGVQALKPEADLLAAVLGVLVLVVLSGALHLDGLADFADALGSRRDRETMLRIMKQSDIGPFGVVAIVTVLLIDVAALTTCITAGFGWQSILIATTASRLTLPWSCRTTIPTARPDGLGALVASTVPLRAAALTTITTLAATLLLTWLTTPSTNHPASSTTPPTPLATPTTALASAPTTLIATTAAVLIAVATALAVTHRARKTLNGITGDVLGATVELALPTTLLTLALTT